MTRHSTPQLERMMKKDGLSPDDCGLTLGSSEPLPESRNPYRCPVSTPADTRRQGMKQPAYVTFTNINRSVNIPSNTHCHFNYALLKKRRLETKIQNKNFDCYFVHDVDRTAHVDAQTRSTWLSSLCAQPVDEIFVKYKQQAEASMVAAGSGRSRHVSTPGEKALVTAWSSNASQRAPSSMSRSTMSARTSAETPTSAVSNTELLYPSLRVYGYDPDPDKQIITPRFGLGPMSPAPPTELMKTNYNARLETPPPTRQRVSPAPAPDPGGLVVSPAYYDQYQRNRRFPAVQARNHPRPFVSPRARRYIGAHNPPATSAQKLDINLEQSKIQVIPLGQLLNHSRIELGNKYSCGCVIGDGAKIPAQIKGKG